MASFFDAPIPGQSLTDEPKNWPWENPPEMVDPEEATKYYINKMANDDVMDDMAVLLDGGMPLAPLVKTLLTTGVMNGMHSIDVSIIIAPVIHSFIKAAMTSYGIEVRDDIEDPAEKIKQKEKARLQTAISIAMADAQEKGAAQDDPGIAMLQQLDMTLEEGGPAESEADMDMEVSTDEPAEPMGLMAKGA